jgi:hypothetical protein
MQGNRVYALDNPLDRDIPVFLLDVNSKKIKNEKRIASSNVRFKLMTTFYFSNIVL